MGCSLNSNVDRRFDCLAAENLTYGTVGLTDNFGRSLVPYGYQPIHRLNPHHKAVISMCKEAKDVIYPAEASEHI